MGFEQGAFTPPPCSPNTQTHHHRPFLPLPLTDDSRPIQPHPYTIHAAPTRTYVHLVDEEGGHDEEARAAQGEGEEPEHGGVHRGVVRHRLLLRVVCGLWWFVG